ncbi:hypothetical protein CVT26_014424 [Gymnopilus dilepis]|uniref:Enoyl reductase (ER) domain-containing protein n=1 Tax=Gymnopilus dilepis TaxID=231916 RepID=A0A409Y7I0_9AGAR|nr:hypothetical protein CVT26_014424 [Gymnopilus dilepis]
MKALVTAEPQTAVVKDIPIPEPGPKEIRVRVHYVALNPIDSLLVANPTDKPGRVVGSDIAGVVEKVGSDVTDWKVGDRVAGLLQGATSGNPRPGGFAEYALLEHDLAIHIPSGVSLEEAATVPLCSLTAAQALFIRLELQAPFPNPFQHKATNEKHPTLLIYSAATSVGLFAIELAKLLRTPSGTPYRIFATASPRNHDKLLASGVEAVFDYKSSTWTEDLRKASGGVSYAVDCIAEDMTTAQISQTFGEGGGKIAVIRKSAWTKDGIRPDVEPIYSAVWWGLGHEIIYNGRMPARPDWREFTVAFYKFLSAGSPKDPSVFPISGNPVRLMPGGLERIVQDGFVLLGSGKVTERNVGAQAQGGKEWMRPISAEKLVYKLNALIGDDPAERRGTRRFSAHIVFTFTGSESLLFSTNVVTPMAPNPSVQRNTSAKLTVAIDIGTTYTAASYHISGNKNRSNLPMSSFQEVNKWPKQTFPDAKIPSVLYYDSTGSARLYGAETLDDTLLMDAEINIWEKAEWWKLRLRPEYLPAPSEFIFPSLPSAVTKVDTIFRDQFAYVIENVRSFFIKAYMNGEKYWRDLATNMDVVLTVPNGWEGRHQQRMRLAAIDAGLVAPSEGSRIKFVSEGEAAIHYCLDSVIVHSVAVGSPVIVCDAGGKSGTTDIGIYKVNSLLPIHLEEIASPQCFLGGGVFVNRDAETFIRGRLKGSKWWDTEECIQSAMKIFEQHIKRSFRGNEMRMHIKLDGVQESDAFRGIERGRLAISGEEMVEIFRPTVDLVKCGLKEVIQSWGKAIDQIFVVGGFAESEHVYHELKTMAGALGIPVSKPDGALSKAVTHGALSWYLGSGVQVRVARLHYGAETEMDFDPNDHEMAGQIKFQDALGRWRVRHAWSTIVKKVGNTSFGHTISATTGSSASLYQNYRLRTGSEHSMPFHRNFTEHESLEVEMELYAYRWDNPPKFFKDNGGHLVDGFIHLGTVQADLTKCYKASRFNTALSGQKYKTLEYDICLLFDEIELRARLRWKEKNSYVFGDATIAYDV